MDSDFDTCECGDYRRDHKNGVGACCFNGPKFDLTHGGKDCLKFRLSEQSKIEKTDPHHGGKTFERQPPPVMSVETILSDLRAIGKSLSPADKMTVELAAQEIESLRKLMDEIQRGEKLIIPKTRRHASDQITLAEASLKTLTR